jgi:protein-tyrosine phosphatase
MNKEIEEWDAHEIIPNLYLGSMEAESVDYKKLQQRNITHVLTSGFGLQRHHETNLKYHKIGAVDVSFYNIVNDLPKCIEFIESALESDGAILVHCAAGVSRSASIVIGYLMQKNQWKFSEALNEVRKKRKIVNPNYGFRNQLEMFEAMNWNLEGNSDAHKAFHAKWNPKIKK